MRRRHLAALLAVFAGAACGRPVVKPSLYEVRGAWVDDHELAYPLESLRGSFAVISMAYGACRRVCSTSLRLLEQLQALADERRVPLQFIVVGLDSSQDRPADWAAYRTERKLQRTNWKFLTGSDASIAQLAHWLGVRYWHYGEHVMHDFRLVLVSPEGQLLAAMTTPDDGLMTLLP